MKKFLFITIMVLIILSFTACDNNTVNNPPISSDNSSDITLEATDAQTSEDIPANTEASSDTEETEESSQTEIATETQKLTETEESTETEEPTETEKNTETEEPVSMTGFVIDTQVYTTKFENGKDVHLEGLNSGIYSKPDRSTSCGSLSDGTEVQVIEVCFEGDDITVGWARILVGASKWEVYIRTSQLKCFVLHEVGFPVPPEELIGKSRLVSSLPAPEKAAIEACFLALGYKTAYMDDGSTMFISNENFEDQLIQNADGSWTEYDGEGNVNYYFDTWQYELLAEYTIPTNREAPEMKIALLGISSLEGVAVSFDPSVTLENVKEYAEKLKSFGYTVELAEAENDGVYVFTASNQKGYGLVLVYSEGQAAMTIQKAVNDTFDLTAFMQSGDIIGNYPSDKLDEFEKTVAASGGRVEHRAKSTLLVFPDGTAEQFFDGSWLIETDTLASTTGGYFPTNAFTAQLMSVYPSTYGFTNDETVFYKQDNLFLATFSDATVEKARQFTAALVIRQAFNLNVYEEENVIDGVAVYYFYAESFDHAIEFECVEGQAATMAIVLIESAE